ncbi:hypothetical protein LWF01_03200 [Saxibacter everestensis]|uniref:Uncharacterized protein n=1 Tax=Saxibacter everestensis TaxID=2909229 RepID=A0ABY8QUW2_9MICO|nr:hypothetical protein LWF01_03200 [Brevibacteriaceae bacterium ZFBP1038]
MTELPDPGHQPADDVSDAEVEAVGALTAALESVERARGHLYSFHQLTGKADFELGDAVQKLRTAGRTELADQIENDVVGRNVLAGRWTFQIIEEYDDGYYGRVKDAERAAREQLLGGVRHVYEARLKERRRSSGRPGHEATPDDA